MLVRLGKIEDAMSVFSKIIHANEDDAQLHYEIGERYKQLAERRYNDHEHAIYFENAVALLERSQELYDQTLSPPPCQSVYARAFLYDSLGHYEKSIEMWEEIILRDKRDHNGENGQWPREMITAIKCKLDACTAYCACTPRK